MFGTREQQGFHSTMPTITAPHPIPARQLDFTVSVYERLLDALVHGGYTFRTFSEYLTDPVGRAVMLRHDVDDRKLHSLAFARIQHAKGARGTYYFRMLPCSFDEEVVREVHALGHEVGYHYEEMDLCRGDHRAAYELFQRNLERLRKVAPVTSICMHGSPRSPYDNKALWEHYDYRTHGIVGEPYFDLDFSRLAYYTDTGRRWDGDAFSVRDRVAAKRADRYHHTLDMVRAIARGTFPEQVMLTFHPQRWTDSSAQWVRELVVQGVKNQAKYGLIQWRSLISKA